MQTSMTGCGSSTYNDEFTTVTVDIRGVNSKQLDLSFRTPSTLRNIENDLRKYLSELFIRGKIDVNIDIKTRKTSTWQIDEEQFNCYYEQTKKIAKNHNYKIKNLSDSLLSTILKLPQSVTNAAESDIKPENLSEIIWETLKTAADEFIKFRKKEGSILSVDILNRIKIIENLLIEITPYEEARVPSIKAKLEKNLSTLSLNPDNNRLEQELIFYFEKLDITEEKTRLQSHLSFFYSTLKEPNSGRKLNFIAQEIGREINTIGSKASESNIQRLVVLMKDELEKIKEQLLNIL